MISTRHEVRNLWRLAWPIIATNFGTMFLRMVDILMVGRIGEEALASVVLANVWISGTSLFAMGIVFGVDPLVSQAAGQGRSDRMGLALQRGVIVALAVSVLLGVLWSFTDRFLLLAGQQEVLARNAHEYTRIQIPSLPFFMVFIALRQYLQGRGILRPALIVILLANVFNALFNWALIFGHLGAPELGLLGAGIATSLTRCVMFLGLFWAIRRFELHRGGWTDWTREAVSFAGLQEILGHGIPVGIMLGLEVWAFGACTLMSGKLGISEAAAHGVVIQMASLSFMLPLGVSFAAVTRVGNLIGAGKFASAQRAGWVAIAMGGVAMGVCGVLFAAGRHTLPRLCTYEPEVIRLSAIILPIAAAFQVFDGLQVVGSGILRGMGRTQPAAWLNLVGYWALAIPLAYFMAFKLELGIAGVWWGLALGLAVVAVGLMLWIRFRGPLYMGRSEKPPMEPESAG